MVTRKQVTVAEYLQQRIAACGKTNAEIAVAMGYEPIRANLISMMRKGQTKLPVNKIAALAKALDENPAFLLRLAMNEYMPETAKAIEEILLSKGHVLLSEGEVALYDLVKKEIGNYPLELNADELAAIQGIVRNALKRTKRELDKRYEYDHSDLAYKAVRGA